MKFILLLLSTFIAINGFSQAIALKVGHSITPADYFGIGYEHYTNGAINSRINFFSESTHKNGLHYSAYGIDLMGEFASNLNERTLFAYRVGIGGTGQIENEPRIYQALPLTKKLNYGLTGELTGEWWMSDQFCLSVFAQQKYLLNSSLGNTRFAFGLGLKFHLGSN